MVDLLKVVETTKRLSPPYLYGLIHLNSFSIHFISVRIYDTLGLPFILLHLTFKSSFHFSNLALCRLHAFMPYCLTNWTSHRSIQRLLLLNLVAFQH